MSAVNYPASVSRLSNVLATIGSKGAKLWLENGRVRYRVPKGAFTRQDLEGLAACESEIVALLAQESSNEHRRVSIQGHAHVECAPLAFSQLAHWRHYRLHERPAIRQIASATHLAGRLNVDVFQDSVATVAHRHGALRTRVVVVGGMPVQIVSASSCCEQSVEDLSMVAERARETQVLSRIHGMIMEPIDVAEGPLSEVRLLKLSDMEHVLIVAMEHMISDASSMGIVLREIFTAYEQTIAGAPVSLPRIEIDFSDYTARQRHAQRAWVLKHGAYWEQRMAGVRARIFPENEVAGAASQIGWGYVPVRIGPELQASLEEWCRLSRTTLVMGVFTAYVALLMRWCGVSDTAILYQTDGRFSPDLRNTVGYVASALCLRMGLDRNDSWLDLIKRVRDEYCSAYEHADASFLESQLPAPEFTQACRFNWIPRGDGLEVAVMADSEHALACSPVPFVHPMRKSVARDIEPSIQLFETSDGIAGELLFPVRRFSPAAMQIFIANFTVFLEALLRRPEGRVMDVNLSMARS